MKSDFKKPYYFKNPVCSFLESCDFSNAVMLFNINWKTINNCRVLFYKLNCIIVLTRDTKNYDILKIGFLFTSNFKTLNFCWLFR